MISILGTNIQPERVIVLPCISWRGLCTLPKSLSTTSFSTFAFVFDTVPWEIPREMEDWEHITQILAYGRGGSDA